jgi:hypothetical protein
MIEIRTLNRYGHRVASARVWPHEFAASWRAANNLARPGEKVLALTSC